MIEPTVIDDPLNELDEEFKIEVMVAQNKKNAENNLQKTLNIKSLFSNSLSNIGKMYKKVIKSPFQEMDKKEQEKINRSTQLLNDIISLMKLYEEDIKKIEEAN